MDSKAGCGARLGKGRRPVWARGVPKDCIRGQHEAGGEVRLQVTEEVRLWRAGEANRKEGEKGMVAWWRSMSRRPRRGTPPERSQAMPLQSKNQRRHWGVEIMAATGPTQRSSSLVAPSTCRRWNPSEGPCGPCPCHQEPVWPLHKEHRADGSGHAHHRGQQSS